MDKQKHLLALGGSSLNIKSIEEAKAHGFYVYVADGNPNSPCFKIADVAICVDITKPQKIYEAVNGFPINGVVSMAEAGVYSCAWLNEKLGLNGININTAMLCTSKAGMRKSWASLPYSVNFKIVTTFEEAENAMAELNTLPIIIKPDKTFGGSRGVSKITSKEQLMKAYKYAVSSGQNNQVVVEGCAEGDEFSCEVVVANSKSTVLCVGQKIKSPLPYRVDCSVNYPAPIDNNTMNAIRDMAQKATNALGLTNGVAHIEFALTENGPRLFELGARCGGGHTPLIAKYVSGVNEFIEYAKIACSIPVNVNQPNNLKGGIYRFIIFEPGLIENITVNPEIKLYKEVYDLVIDSKPGHFIQELRSTSDRSGACIVFSNTLEEADRIADFVCKNITVKYTDGTIKTAKSFNSN